MFMLPFSLLAQPHWEGGFAFGAAGYQGELAPRWYPELSEKGVAYGLFFRRHLSRQLALRLDLEYAEISGNDRNFNQEGFDIRNFRFKSQLGRAGLLLEWEPLGQRRYPNPYQFKALAFSPYIFTGAGLLYTDAKADFSQSRTDKLTHLILIDQAIPMPDTRFYVPFGVGFKLDLSQRAVIGLEAGTLTAFTDYLDGISQSGNPGAKDWMSFAQLTFTLRIVAKDSDRDGIADKEDNCPLVAGNWTALGCPDEDGDGVEDLEDICPAAAGSRQLNGCPDTDGDGVADWEDRCPNLRGTLATIGCPDFDHDGLADQAAQALLALVVLALDLQARARGGRLGVACRQRRGVRFHPGGRFHHHCPDSTRIATSQSSKISSLAIFTRTPCTPGICISRRDNLPISVSSRFTCCAVHSSMMIWRILR